MGNYIQNDASATSKILITLVEGFKRHYGIPSKLLLDLTTQRLTIDQFYNRHLLKLNFNKTQTNKIVAALTGYSPGTVSNWRSKTTPASVERILGIIDVIINIFAKYKVTITKRQES